MSCQILSFTSLKQKTIVIESDCKHKTRKFGTRPITYQKTMNSNRFIHNAGLILILFTAFIMLVLLKQSTIIRILFSIGVLMLLAGRFTGKSSEYSLYRKSKSNLTIHRLYLQRLIGSCILVLSIALLFLPQGFYWGYYIRKSFWFIPFLIFCVIEVYTVFRLSSLEHKNNH